MGDPAEAVEEAVETGQKQACVLELSAGQERRILRRTKKPIMVFIDTS